jgi:hypothetical protein
LLANITEKKPLIFYCEMKLEWDKEEYTVCCARNEINKLACLKSGICKLTGMRK